MYRVTPPSGNMLVKVSRCISVSVFILFKSTQKSYIFRPNCFSCPITHDRNFTYETCINDVNLERAREILRSRCF